MSRLPTSKKVAYATGGLAMNLTNLVISQWIFKLYVPNPSAALVPVALFSTIFFLGRVTDAITDPLVAYWSDKLRSKRGRRIPFILYGLGPFVLVYFLLWAPPMDGQHWLNAVWAVLLVQAYFILYTVVVTPYLALLPEITSDLKERVNISTLQAVFVMVGTIVFAVIGLVIEHGGWIALGGLVALLSIVSFVPTIVAIKEKPAPEPVVGDAATSVSLIQWVTLTFKNRPFIYLVVSTSCYWFGLNLLLMLIPYWVEDLLGLTQDSAAIVMGPFLGMNALFFLIFNLLAKKIGKFPMFLVTMGGSAVAVPLLSAVGHLPFGSELTQTAVAMGIFGIPVAGFMMLPFAILADVVDWDEQLTGQRREGIYFGVQAIFQKAMIGSSIFTFGMVVLGGDDGGVNIEGLKAIPFIAAGAFLAGFVAFIGYPLREREGKVALS